MQRGVCLGKNFIQLSKRYYNAKSGPLRGDDADRRRKGLTITYGVEK